LRIGPIVEAAPFFRGGFLALFRNYILTGLLALQFNGGGEIEFYTRTPSAGGRHFSSDF
jgi:hypothetical protein